MYLFGVQFYISDNLGLTDEWFGYLVAIGSFGSVFGYALSGMLKVSKRTRPIIILSFMFLNGISYILLGFLPILIPVIIIFFVSGFFGGYIQVQIYTILQLITESTIRGRVFGFLGTITSALAPIGMGLGGILADIMNKGIPVIFIGCGGMITLLILILIPSRDVHKILSVDETDSVDAKKSDSIAPIPATL